MWRKCSLQLSIPSSLSLAFSLLRNALNCFKSEWWVVGCKNSLVIFFLLAGKNSISSNSAYHASYALFHHSALFSWFSWVHFRKNSSVDRKCLTWKRNKSNAVNIGKEVCFWWGTSTIISWVNFKWISASQFQQPLSSAYDTLGTQAQTFNCSFYLPQLFTVYSN